MLFGRGSAIGKAGMVTIVLLVGTGHYRSYRQSIVAEPVRCL
jgi:hypothetical protein